MRYAYLPPYEGSRVDHVGTYRRLVPVSLDRMYENALDWAHLSHLHASSFTGIECVEAGAWGWRAWVDDPRGGRSLLELRLDRDCQRWITRNLQGPNTGAEIWTHVFERAERELDLVIDFFVPGVPEPAREKVGQAYARAYETLYDEDVWMMSERQIQLDRRLDSVRSEDVLRVPAPAVDALPHAVTLSGRALLLNQIEGQWVVYPAQCPHQLGPLDGPLNARGEVTCPWHGFVFDVRSGACTQGPDCRLGQVPDLLLEGGDIVLSWP